MKTYLFQFRQKGNETPWIKITCYKTDFPTDEAALNYGNELVERFNCEVRITTSECEKIIKFKD